MKTHYLSFGEIIVLEPNIAEVIIYQGVLMDLQMVEEYHATLLEHLEAPFFLLINKKFAYTYTFEAQNEIANLREIKGMAVVVEGYVGKKSTEFLIAINESKSWNIQTFSNKTEALNWIKIHN
ncbi:hypothetical protein HNV08_13530 [Winogradskyella eckloniae]|uniref:hypothetical protein n=1 Tax=Winogradskyella eckloniae TaxID=1089306 RepID=UPI001566BC7A|nr:hypothetical protein [Winogradskyella eckloniae]NRD21073.1 hypothetical protein [Winogradskyella eckloniae]